MNEYHKIQSVFKRNPDNNYKTFLEGQYSMPEFEYLKDNHWIFTEKVDGTNIRVLFDGEEFKFKGKSEKAQMPIFLLEHLQEYFGDRLDKFKAKFPKMENVEDCKLCFYGEGYGARIQGSGGNYSKTPRFVLFDIKIGEWWLTREDCEEIARELEIDIVPIIGSGTLNQMIKLCASGYPSKWGKFAAEGIVAKPKVDLRCRNGQRIIVKVKHKDFVIG